MVKLKRVREPADRSDGYRVLVERLWPRGVRKQSLSMDEWAKDSAPSADLRKWFGHDPDRWLEFRRRYRRELRGKAAGARIHDLAERAAHGTVTLLFSTHDAVHSNAVVLKNEIERRAGRRSSMAEAPRVPAQRPRASSSGSSAASRTRVSVGKRARRRIAPSTR